MTRRKIAAIVAGFAVAGGLGAALAYAATNDAGSITACVAKDGTPHIVAAGTACKDKEATVSWAIQGPQGPAGPQGAQGAKGDQGPAGASGGDTLTVIGNVAMQGHGNVAIKGGDDGTQTTMDVLSFSQGIVSPRDAASGQATGKRQYKPITIVKRVDASTPRLFQACATNETLPTVTFVLHPPGASADQLKVTLTNAACADLTDTTSEGGTMELETIHLTFQKIQIEHLIAKTSFQDDWEAPVS
jgi:type VI secretion system secreted protein Hcp